MELLILVIVGIVLFLWLRSRRRSGSVVGSPGPAMKAPEAPAVGVTVTWSGSSGVEIPEVGDVTASNGAWVLNPSSTFPLTVEGVDRAQALELRKLLDDSFRSRTYAAARVVSQLVARTNLRCREIDEYVQKFKPPYRDAIERQKAASSDWSTATERDRDDLLTGFRRAAIDSLDVRPYCDPEVLFEGEPADATIDDALIDRYGYVALQLYLRYADKLEKVRVVPADRHDRQGFEQLVRLGLARQGNEIQIDGVLETFTLKQLDELVADVNTKPFTRKQKAVEFLRGVSDLNARLAKVVAYRELFQLKPLPPEFASLDLKQISAAWRYAAEIAELLTHTFMMAGYATRDRRDGTSGYASGWRVLATDDSCPFCRRAAGKLHPKTRRPKVPLHIGCRCTAVAEIGDR